MIILVDAAKIFDNLSTYLPLESYNKTRNKIKLKSDRVSSRNLQKNPAYLKRKQA